MRLRHSVADQQSAEKGACSATIKVRLSDRDGVTMFGLIVALQLFMRNSDCGAFDRRKIESSFALRPMRSSVSFWALHLVASHHREPLLSLTEKTYLGRHGMI